MRNRLFNEIKENYKEFACDLCDSRDAVEVPYARDYTGGQPVYICRHCGFVYVKFRRSAEEIAKSWSCEIFGNHYTARIPAVKARQVYVADFIHRNIGLKSKRVCDIGAGEGQFLEIIRKEYGAEVFGIEASKENCRRLAKNGIKFFNGTIEEYSTSRQMRRYKADIVTIIWALENCMSCRDMLTAAYRILRNNGYIVIATGSRILVPFKKPLSLYFSKNPADTNSFRFSANTLRGILTVSGFEVVCINRYIDSDVLCMIAQKASLKRKIRWNKDNYLEVYDFFKRWHKESQYYRAS